MDSRNGPPARIGDRLEDIDTPALVVDLDAFERNLAAMAQFARENNIRLRPHAKTHKCVEVAKRQIALGAVGQCVQKVGEAEVLVAGGIEDVLVSNQVVGASKLDRLATLASRATISLCFDDAEQILAASDAARRAGVTIGGLVEIETGMGRCGVPSGPPACELAKRIANAPGLRLRGIQAYQGKAQHFRTTTERAAAIDVAVLAIRQTLDALDRAGLKCESITGAGTGTYRNEATSGLYTELQCGSYAFMDADYAANRDEHGESVGDFAHSLFILTTTMSVAGGDWCVVDAGLKSFSGESGMPLVHERAGLSVVGLSDEHAKVVIAPGATKPSLGAKLLLIPGHCDPTINLHDHYVCVRKGRVEAIWEIGARGASR
jgi:D-serine deaminase-like pyridoxal phosphate-dependent protein